MNNHWIFGKCIFPLLLAVSCISCSSSSGEDSAPKYYEDENGICFLSYNNATEAWVTDYKGDKENLIIPEQVTIDGKTLPVKRIEHHAFYDRSVLKSIQLPTSVTSVGEEAFARTSLESLYITENLFEIPSSAWSSTSFSPKVESGISFLASIDNPYCIAFSQIATPNNYHCPAGIKSIFDETFKNVSFSANPDFSRIRFIGNGAFSGAKILGDINLSNVIRIGSKAFENIQGATSIHISKDATIQSDTLYKCGSLDSLSMPMPIDVSNFSDRSFGEKIELNYLALYNGNIPDGFSAGPNAQINVKKLSLNNMTRVGSQAFSHHAELATLELTDIESIGREAFSFANLDEVYIPQTVKEFGHLAFYTDDPLTLYIGKTLHEIENDRSLAYDLSGLGSQTTIRYGVVKSDEVTEGDFKYKFDAAGYASITSYIGDSTNVTIPEKLGGRSVNTLSKTTFIDSPDIVSLTILPKLRFEKEALAPLHHLKQISMNARSIYTIFDQTQNVDFIQAFGQQSFEDSYSINRSGSTYYIPNTLQKLILSADNEYERIPASSFAGFTSLTEVSLPNNGSTIEDNAFKNCSNVKDVYVPAKTKLEGQYALGFGASTIIRLDSSLNGYSSLSNWTDSKHIYNVEGDVPVPIDSQGVTYSYLETGPATVVSIEEGATDVIIPNEFNGHPVTSIASKAFENAGDTLISLVIPSSVSRFQTNALYGLKALQKLTVPFVGMNNQFDDDGATFSYPFGLQEGEEFYYVGSNSLPLSLEEVHVTEATKIAKNAFSGCSHIKRIILREDIDHIGANAFEDCVDLTAFYWGESLSAYTHWPDYFYHCKPTLYTSYSETQLQPYHYSGATKIIDFDEVYYGKTYAEYLDAVLL